MEYTSDWEVSPETMDQMIKRRVIDILNDVDDTIEVDMDDDLQQAGFDTGRFQLTLSQRSVKWLLVTSYDFHGVGV